ncbi:MAG: pimelyl-ACP methyl ester esterase [Betaproteobacteria bacterium HGW-Betaproteobacteria-7]|jgi:pimeloyl-[acyl-carrier protein] methyl ester esterase|nr:MAG: pimelyl-ACP methyl ester esterase [Betaproteobacteria bacterium HGW-Betaproteobacteria-7]
MNPLVILPGWALGRGPLLATAEVLGGRIIDLPGYGETPAAASFNAAVDAMAERLAPGTTLAGWSLGAMLALAIAARAPEKVGKLLLIAGTVSFVQRDGWPDAMPPGTLAEFAGAIAADAAAMLPRFVGGFNRGDSRAREVTSEILALTTLPPTEVLLSGLDWLRDTDLRADAGQVAAPTLLVQGSADPLMPLSAGTVLAAMIPGSRLCVLEDCAHAPFLSHPADFLASVTAFVHD